MHAKIISNLFVRDKASSATSADARSIIGKAYAMVGSARNVDIGLLLLVAQ